MSLMEKEYEIQGDYVHYASPNESWGWIALRYYGDESQFPRLVRANPELERKVFFDGGEMVRVPIVSEEELAVSSYAVPPWRV